MTIKQLHCRVLVCHPRTKHQSHVSHSSCNLTADTQTHTPSCSSAQAPSQERRCSGFTPGTSHIFIWHSLSHLHLAQLKQTSMDSSFKNTQTAFQDWPDIHHNFFLQPPISTGPGKGSFRACHFSFKKTKHLLLFIHTTGNKAEYHQISTVFHGIDLESSFPSEIKPVRQAALGGHRYHAVLALPCKSAALNTLKFDKPTSHQL